MIKYFRFPLKEMQVYLAFQTFLRFDEILNQDPLVSTLETHRHAHLICFKFFFDEMLINLHMLHAIMMVRVCKSSSSNFFTKYLLWKRLSLLLLKSPFNHLWSLKYLLHRQLKQLPYLEENVQHKGYINDDMFSQLVGDK